MTWPELKAKGWKATMIDDGVLYWHPRDPGNNTISLRHAAEIQKLYDRIDRNLGGKGKD
jgi:hypothetical protein